MNPRIYNVLFLCTGNSARSIMAEALLNALGKGSFKAYSAGSHPKGEVHPLALEQIRNAKLPDGDYRSKSWSEFAQPSVPTMDFVFTVCDSAAQEACPVWPGQPMTAHWGIPDPAAAAGTMEAQRKAFLAAFVHLQTRIRLLVSLPIGSLDRLSLHRKLGEIGQA